MSNRSTKEKLFKEDNRCHWCRKPTVLTNLSRSSIPSNAATVDHLISRLSPHRWVRKKPNQRRKVLACCRCNTNRSIQETLCLSRAEILKRSQGYSLSPRGKPKIIRTLKTLKEVRAALDI